MWQVRVAGQYFSFRNLKYSRDNETEADYMGLIFAAMAGYDPQQAIPFWKRCRRALAAIRVIFSVITLQTPSVLLPCRRKCLLR